MALQGFLHVNFSFCLPVQSCNTRIHTPQGIVRESGDRRRWKNKKPRKTHHQDRHLNPQTLSPGPSVWSITPRHPAQARNDYGNLRAEGGHCDDHGGAVQGSDVDLAVAGQAISDLEIIQRVTMTSQLKMCCRGNTTVSFNSDFIKTQRLFQYNYSLKHWMGSTQLSLNLSWFFQEYFIFF